jgi:hypothetical protein
MGEKHIVDLCSGGGGYIEQVYEGLDRIERDCCTVTLTDKYPNVSAYQLISDRTNGKIGYCGDSIDVFNVPKELKGFRVLYSAVHHFKPEQVKSIVRDAVNSNASIGIFDGGEKNIRAILGILIIHPIAFLLFTPFLKPFKFSRLFFTYIIPIIPLYTIWDGIVSILRMYQPEELLEMAELVGSRNYTWKSGRTKNRFGLSASYLIGYPKEIR